MLDKLHLYGIQTVSEDWFRSNSTKRRKKINVQSANTNKIFFSNRGTMKHGGIQG